MGCQQKWESLSLNFSDKESVAMQEIEVQPLGQEDPLEKGMVTHFSLPACGIPWTEEPRGLQSMRSQRVGHD